jgi:NAD(P)-dependent dehydrogenase (short-subunit alcohol dehydrogenase family)
VSTFVQRVTGYSDEEYRNWLQQTERIIPMGRASTGEDCARVIVFVASNLCAVTTGAVIPVDGALQFVGGASNSDVLKSQVK